MRVICSTTHFSIENNCKFEVHEIIKQLQSQSNEQNPLHLCHFYTHHFTFKNRQNNRLWLRFYRELRDDSPFFSEQYVQRVFYVTL